MMLNTYHQKWQTLIPDKVKPPVYHLLPKIHKPNNPGRPVISSATPTLAEYLNSFIITYNQQ